MPYSKRPYSLDKAEVSAAFFLSGPQVVGVPEETGVNTMCELIEHAKKNPIKVGSCALGPYPQMVADLLSCNEDPDIVTINYRGDSLMWVDVEGGQLQEAIGNHRSFATLQPRGFRAIGAAGSAARINFLMCPPVPSKASTVVWSRWNVVLPPMAPAGTPEVVLYALLQVVAGVPICRKLCNCVKHLRLRTNPRLKDARISWARDVPVGVRLAVDLAIRLEQSTIET